MLLASEDGAKWIAGVGVVAVILAVIFAEKWADNMAAKAPNKPAPKPAGADSHFQPLTIWRGFVFGLGIALAFLLVETVASFVVLQMNDGKLPAAPYERSYR